MEEWKEIKGYEGLYEVSNYGNVRSLDRTIESHIRNNPYTKFIKGCLMKPVSNGLGYLQISLGIGSKGKSTKYYVHRLVYLTFVGEIEDGYEINHKDHDKGNNKLSNLELVNKSDNQRKSRIHYNTLKKPIICPKCGGEKIGKKKDSVCLECHNKNKSKHIPPKEEILELLKTNSYVGVGKIYGVSDNTIKRWSQRT